ncbi:Nuclear pore complex protein, partial [Globisporangium polare]
DTSTKAKPPAFAAGGYPPDTSTKAKPPPFSLTPAQGGEKNAAKSEQSSFSFSSFGGGLFGSKTESTSASTGGSTSLFGKPAAAKSLFGTASNNQAADKPSQPSPFGIVPKSDAKSSFSLPAAPSTTSFSANAAKPAATSSDPKPSVGVKAPVSKVENGTKGMPKSVLEGQLWKLIIDFDKSFQRIKRNSKSIQSEDKKFSDQVTSQLRKLQTQVSSLCNDINSLDDSRDQIEKDVLFVIGSDGDVHEQLEYGREILASFKDETLKRSLEEQPLDQRSEETRQALKEKLDEVERTCADLENHVASTKLGSSGIGAAGLNSVVSTAHLFRVLKQTYDNSKLQYNKVSSLAQQMDDLTLGSERMMQSTGGNSTAVFEATVPFAKSKTDMAELITESEQRSQDVRQHFLALCNNVVTPRDVFSAPRRKLTSTSSSGTSSPLRIKAYSKLMPRTQLTVASPMSSTKSTSNSVSFKGTEVKSGSRLFSLTEDKTPKDPAKFIQTPQRAKPSVGQAPERPTLGGVSSTSSSTPEPSRKGSDASGAKPSLFGSNAFSASQSAKIVPPSSSFSLDSSNNSNDQDNSKRARNATPFGSVPDLSVKPKPAATTEVAKKEPSTQSAFGSVSGFGAQKSADKPATTTTFSAPASTTNHKALLAKFYEEYNPSKVSEAEKTLAGYAGREEELFSKLFTKYIPASKPEDVKKYLSGGSLPKKQVGFGAAPATGPSKPAFSPFGAPATSTSAEDSSKKPSPFGAISSSGFGAAAAKPATTTATGFGAFGTSTASTTGSASASPFGQPAVDYRQRLVDFYTKHNPAKLSDVDATLAKYKGNEEKLFQNLASKYKVSPGGIPSSPAIQPANASAASSPFGNAGSFSSISLSGNAQPSTGFGSSSFGGGFGAKPAPSSSPFGAAPQASNPFGSGASTTSSGFGTSTTTGGAGAGAFGTSSQFGSGGGFGAAGNSEHREKLVKFYQQFNPEKLKDVDSTLEKYKGQESRLFAMLEQKYLGKPAAPAAPAFGAASTPSFGGGFGAPSALGASAAPAFGSSSMLGAPAQPVFGGSAQPAFGAASAFGAAARTPVAGGFGAQPAASAGAQAAGTGFSSFSTQGATFGGFGAQPAAATGGFGSAGGSGFGGGAAPGGGFSQFGNSNSFTQMRS